MRTRHAPRGRRAAAVVPHRRAYSTIHRNAVKRHRATALTPPQTAVIPGAGPRRPECGRTRTADWDIVVASPVHLIAQAARVRRVGCGCTLHLWMNVLRIGRRPRISAASRAGERAGGRGGSRRAGEACPLARCDTPRTQSALFRARGSLAHSELWSTPNAFLLASLGRGHSLVVALRMPFVHAPSEAG